MEGNESNLTLASLKFDTVKVLTNTVHKYCMQPQNKLYMCIKKTYKSRTCI